MKETTIKDLEAIQKELPGIRLGVLMQAAIDTKKKSKNFDLSDVSDKEFVTAIREYKDKIKTKRVKPPKLSRRKE